MWMALERQLVLIAVCYVLVGEGFSYVPNVVDDGRSLRYSISHVRILLEGCVWYPEDDRRHPPQTLLDAAPNVRQVWVVVDGR